MSLVPRIRHDHIEVNAHLIYKRSDFEGFESRKGCFARDRLESERSPIVTIAEEFLLVRLFHTALDYPAPNSSN
jgi:hypothetical protein